MFHNENPLAQKRPWYLFLLVYVFWIGVGAACFALFLLLRNTITTILALTINSPVLELGGRTRWVITSLEKTISIILAVSFIGLMVFTERYFHIVTHTKELFRRCARIFGILLLLVFAAHLPVFILTDSRWNSWLEVLLLTFSLLVGAGLLVLSIAYYRVFPAQVQKAKTSK